MVEIAFNEETIKTQTPMSKEFAEKFGKKLNEFYMSASWYVDEERNIILNFMLYEDGYYEWSLSINSLKIIFEYEEELIELLKKLKVEVKSK